MTKERTTQRTAKAVGHRTRVGQERRARTQARIVEAALRVFARQSPEAAVIDDFIREAGVSRGTFYNYFTRTEQLLAAASACLENDLIQSIEAEIARLDEPAARVATGVRLWLAWSRADRTGCGFVVKSRFRGEAVDRVLTSDLSAGLESGAFQFRSIATARDFVVGAILEAMNRILAGPVPRNHADEVTGLILRGLGLDARRTARLLGSPAPRLRRPVRSLG